jgi:tRNA(adenine34) deaminase
VEIAAAHNTPRTDHDPTAHAEIMAIRAAAKALGDERLTGCELWVTLEPCAMCAGAIAHARIARLYYAASDPKGGAVEHGARVFEQPQCLHRPEVYSGMGEDEAAELLKGFFRVRR